MAKQVRVKVCGITRVSDAEAAAEFGVDAIGLVFYPKSSRHLSDLALAREIALSVGPFVSVVALFVNPEPNYVEQVLQNVPISVIQFHGDEDDAFCSQFARPFMKALRMKPGIDAGASIGQYPSASALLLDAYMPGIPGGTGESFDWGRFPKVSAKPLILAGGLTPDNVGLAIETTQPYAVDVSGGVEESPGLKSCAKMRAFIDTVRL